MRTTLLRVLVIPLWSTLLAAQDSGQQLAQHPGNHLISEIEQHVERQVEAQSLVGLSVAVGIDGELVWTRGFGVADLEGGVPATEHTVYRLASVSKPVTASAVMQLVEKGRIDLDAPIDSYVPEWPEKRWPVTTRQLLCHQGGVRHYLESDAVQNTKAYATAMEALEYFSADPLIEEPGTSYLYSSYGYNLLGAVVEGAAEKPYVDYLKEHVFAAAGTEAMQDDSQARVIPNRARGYRKVNGKVQNAMLVDTSYKVGAGGLCGTAADLVRFAHAMQAGELVQASTRDRMWSRQETDAGVETEYGLGWFVGKDRSGRKIVRHGGAQTGAMASLVYFVDDGVVVAMLCNSEWCDPPLVVVPIVRMLVSSRR